MKTEKNIKKKRSGSIINNSSIVNNFIIINNSDTTHNIESQISEINEMQKKSFESTQITNNLIYGQIPNITDSVNNSFIINNKDKESMHKKLIDNFANEITQHKSKNFTLEKFNKSGDVVYYKPLKENFWTVEEDKLLIELCKNNKFLNWQSVSLNFKDKSNIQCSARYRRIKPGMVKGNFSESEDKKILELIEKFGKNWSIISDYFITRTNKQIRDRYINVLDPKLNKAKFSEEEDNLIIKLYETIGCKWSEMQSYFTNRTPDNIKNRFYSSLRKKFFKLDYCRSKSKNIKNQNTLSFDDEKNSKNDVNINNTNNTNQTNQTDKPLEFNTSKNNINKSNLFNVKKKNIEVINSLNINDSKQIQKNDSMNLLIPNIDKINNIKNDLINALVKIQDICDNTKIENNIEERNLNELQLLKGNINDKTNVSESEILNFNRKDEKEEVHNLNDQKCEQINELYKQLNLLNSLKLLNTKRLNEAFSLSSTNHLRKFDINESFTFKDINSNTSISSLSNKNQFSKFKEAVKTELLQKSPEMSELKEKELKKNSKGSFTPYINQKSNKDLNELVKPSYSDSHIISKSKIIVIEDKNIDINLNENVQNKN